MTDEILLHNRAGMLLRSKSDPTKGRHSHFDATSPPLNIDTHYFLRDENNTCNKNGKDIEHIGNTEEMEHFESIEDIEDIEENEGVKQFRNIQDMEDVRHLRDVENSENAENLENLENLENFGDLENFGNLENLENIENIENIDNQQLYSNENYESEPSYKGNRHLHEKTKKDIKHEAIRENGRRRKPTVQKRCSGLFHSSTLPPQEFKYWFETNLCYICGQFVPIYSQTKCCKVPAHSSCVQAFESCFVCGKQNRESKSCCC